MPLTLKYTAGQSPSTPAPNDTAAFAQKWPAVSKVASILEELLTGRRITARDAAFDLHIFCLASLIHYLRKYHHIPVKTKMIKVIDRYGHVTRYGEYFLVALDIAEINARKVPQ